MKNLFEQSRSHWVRYDHYELKTAKDGKRYITPGKDAKPEVYNPLKVVPDIVLDALNVGMLMMGRKPAAEVERAVLEFVTRYGLLGMMTALPTTPAFMDEPMAKTMSFQRQYAEPYDWVAQQFKDWAFTLTTSILYYQDYHLIDQDTRELYQKAMAAFGGIAPGYHIELLDKPTIYWDFHSLLLGIQMMFSFMLVYEEHPLRLCKNCQKVFLGSHVNTTFCSPQCKNQYNVHKNREKAKGKSEENE